MHYKTMVLGLLEERPQLYEHLRQQRMLLPALELYATMLKTAHEICREQMAKALPESDPTQLTNDALEPALQALQGYLDNLSLKNEDEELSLDEAMEYIRRHTPPV